MDVLELSVVIGTAFAAAVVSSIAGAGMTPMLLPVLVLYLGIHEAFPVVTFALITASSSRAVVNRRSVDMAVVAWFSLGSLPLTTLGTYLFTITEPGPLTRLLGVFLIGAVIWGRLKVQPPRKRHPAWFLPVGAGFGFLVGLGAGAGPFLAPFFLAHGLRKGAYVGTAGLAILIVQIAKLIIFGQADFLTERVFLMGGPLIPFIILGTVLGKRVLTRLPEKVFERIIEAVMLASGLVFLIRG